MQPSGKEEIKDREQISGCQGLRVGKKTDYKEQHKEVFWGDRNVLNPDCDGN